MGVCRVSKLMTINKWKGYFVHRYVVAKAKEIKEESGISMRGAIISIQKEVLNKTNSKHSLQERADMLNKILTIKKDDNV